MLVEQYKKNDTDFLRFFAILLVVNSHLDQYYPIAHLGTGGAVAISLFFLLSSYGLTLSYEKNPQLFSEWAIRRIAKIFPSLWVTILLIHIPLEVYNGSYQPEASLEYIGKLIWPPFWFLDALLIFYVAGWFLISRYSFRLFSKYALSSVLIYGLLYWLLLDPDSLFVEDLPFRVVNSFFPFLLGVILAKNHSKIRYSGKSDLFFCLLALVVMYGHKFLMLKGMYGELQFVQQICCLLVSFYMFKISRSEFVVDFVMGSRFSFIVKRISKITLEIYIVHMTISDYVLELELGFPLNIIVFLALTFILSSVVNYLATYTKPKVVNMFCS